MSFENVVYRSFNEHLGGSSVDTFVGSQGELFWDPDTQTLRMSDGATPGGLPLSSGTAPYKRLDSDEISSTAVCYINMMGQSNGDGTSQFPSEDAITVPLNNVYALTRPVAIVDNTVDDGVAWTDESTWTWSKFTSDHALYNLSRYRTGANWMNFTTELAREWQRLIDTGVNLPDLYLTHMSYSGNGFGNSAQNSTRYNPIESQASLRSNIWTGSLKTHAWALSNLLETNEAVIHLGVVNNQWEHDGKVLEEALAYQSWMDALLSEHDKIAGIPVPFTYWVPSTPGSDDRFGFYKEIKRGLESIGGRPKISIDPKLSTLYDTSIVTNPGFYGIYNDDVHYKNDLWNGTFIPQFFDQNGFEGLLMTSAGGTSSSSGGSSTDLSNYYTKSETDTIVTLNTNITDWQANGYISAPVNIVLPGVTYETINVPASGWQVQMEDDNKKYFRLVDRGNNYSFLSFSGLPADTSYGSVIMSLKQGSRISIAAGFGQNDKSGSSFQNNGKEFIAIVFATDTGHGQLNDASNCMMQIWNISNGASKAGEIFVPNSGFPELGSGQTGITANIDLKFTCAPATSGIATEYNFEVSYKLAPPVSQTSRSTESSTLYTPITTLTNVDMSAASAAVLSGGGVGLVSGVGDAFSDAMVSSMRFKSFGIISGE